MRINLRTLLLKYIVFKGYLFLLDLYKIYALAIALAIGYSGYSARFGYSNQDWVVIPS